MCEPQRGHAGAAGPAACGQSSFKVTSKLRGRRGFASGFQECVRLSKGRREVVINTARAGSAVRGAVTTSSTSQRRV